MNMHAVPVSEKCVSSGIYIYFMVILDEFVVSRNCMAFAQHTNIIDVS